MFFIVKELYSNKERLEKHFVKLTCACSIPFFTKPNCYMVNYIGIMNNQESNHFCNSAFKKKIKDSRKCRNIIIFAKYQMKLF